MSADGEHYTLDEFNRLLDSGIEPSVLSESDRHLKVCPRCAAFFKQVAQVDRALRSMPLPHTRAEFTSAVMQRISHDAPASLTSRLIDQSVAMLSFFVVLAVLFGSILILRQQGSPAEIAPVSDIVGQGISAAGQIVGDAVSWIRANLSSVFGEGFAIAWISIVVGGIALALLDRLIARRVVSRQV